MSIETDVSLWKQVSTWLWTGLLPLVAVAWRLVNQRIDDTKAKADAALPKVDFERQVEKHREDIKELFGRSEALKDHVNARVETLRTDMHESLGRLRDTMERGFGDMRKEMNELVKVISRRKGE